PAALMSTWPSVRVLVLEASSPATFAGLPLSFLVTYSAKCTRVCSPLGTIGNTDGEGSGIDGQPRQITPRALISSVHAGASTGPPHTANAPSSSTAFTASARAATSLSDVPAP